MNLQPLFMTSRVIVTIYRTASAAVLLYYLGKRLANREPPRQRRGRFGQQY